MKKALFILLLPTLLSLNALPVLAQSTMEEPALIISEISPFPRDPDFIWVELYNDGDTHIDLDGWSVSNATNDTLELAGAILPDQYQVIILGDGFVSADDELILIDSSQDTIDHWSFSIDLQEGQSIILENEILVATSFTTAGRPNILQADQGLQCPIEENSAPIEPPPITNSPPPSTPIIFDTGGIIINELLANPSGDETEGEFIELFNPENRLIHMEQWIIQDASKGYILPNLEIQPHGFLILPRSLTSIALNNSNETLTLIDPFGKIIHEMAYKSTIEDQSWNYLPESHWYQANPTPGLENNEEIIEVEEPQEVTATPPTEYPSTEETIPEPITPDSLDSNLNLIELSEILPNPTGSDDMEWLELYNPTTNTVVLKGLILSDTAKSFTFTDQSIGPKEFYLLHRSESLIALNNSKETVSLSVDDIITDEFTYESSQEQVSWSKVDGEWLETSILTPGEDNIPSPSEDLEIEESPLASAVKKSSSKETKKSLSYASVEFEQWGKIKDEELIEIVGMITVLPGNFSSRSAYLQNIDSAYPLSIELYFHKANWPQLNTGDQLKISGEKSITSRGERLLIKSEDNISLITEGDAYFTDFNNALSYTLVGGNATLVEQNKNELIIDIKGEEIFVDLKKAKIDLDEIDEGVEIRIQGILKHDNSKSILIPRTKDDIEIISQPIVISSVQEEISITKTTPKNYSYLIWLAIGSISASLIVLLAVHHKSLFQIARSLLFQVRHKYNI